MPPLALLLPALAAAGAPTGPHAQAWEAARAGLVPLQPDLAAPPAPPPPTAGPARTVYGYWPYWGDDIDTIAWDSLSHLAIFGVVLESDGSLSSTGNWTEVAAEAMELGERYDVRVHLCLIGFEDDVHAAVFPSAERRQRAIDELVDLVEAYGAHGVNVDIEGLDSHLRDDFTTFIQELRAEVEDLYIAMPSVDWSSAYDYPALAEASDGLFIMAYGYHYSSGDPGPISPLHGGDPWSVHAIDWTVEDYRDKGVADEELIVGLPLYGRNWPSVDSSVPGDATSEGQAVTWVHAISQGEAAGRHWDASTSTPYAFPDSTHQLWYDDVESIEDKAGWALEEGLQGFGFWAVTYDQGDPELWAAMDALTAPEPGDSDPPQDSDDPGEPPGLRGLAQGCGCASSGRGSPLLLAALLGLAGLRGRRR
jgi:spore germination protein